MKIGQIIKYGLVALGAATLFACVTPNKQKIEYSQPVQRAENSQPVKQNVCDEDCKTNVVPYSKPKQRPFTVENLVECLASNGAVLYGASWCPHCQIQKAMFEDELKNIKYVECATYEGAKKCDAAGIHGYPTWVINGNHYTGTKSLQKLSDIAGCNLK